MAAYPWVYRSDHGPARASRGAWDPPDGIYCPSRLDEERRVAPYDRAVAELAATLVPQLPDCRAVLAFVLDDLGDAIA